MASGQGISLRLEKLYSMQEAHLPVKTDAAFGYNFSMSSCRASPGHGMSVMPGPVRVHAATADDAVSEPHRKQPIEVVRLGPVSVTANEATRLWGPALAAYILHANLDGKGASENRLGPMTVSNGTPGIY